MKNKKYLLAFVGLFAILLSACAGAVTETSTQSDDQSAPGVESPSKNNARQNGTDGPAQDGRGERDLTAAAEALGVTVEELQAALQASIHADCANLTDQNTQPGNREGCRPNLNVAAETLGITVEELQAALGAGKVGGRGERNLTTSAETLGISVEVLQQAIEDAKPAECADQTQPTQGVDCRPDMEALAVSLGVTVEELEAALGRRGPDFAAVAETLGVTEEDLRQALEDAKSAECATTEDGQPKDPNCRPDIEVAAETLGVTAEELQQALGKPEGGRGGRGGNGQPSQGSGNP